MRPRFAVLAAVLALGFPSPSTASVPEIDSPAVSSDSVAESQDLSVGLERDSIVMAVRVEPSSGFVRVIHADGAEEYIPNHRIRWIHDATGKDVTGRVLDRGKSVGEVPVTIRYAAQPASRTLRGRPLPIRKKFPVIQAGLLARLDRDHAHPGDPPPVSLSIDIGGMKNVSERWAVGGTFFFAGDENFSRIGPKVRFRRWLGSDIAIDMAPGLLFSTKVDGPSEFLPGFVGELGVSIGDWVSVTGQMEASRRQQHFVYAARGWEGVPRTREYTEVSWYLGGKFGGEAALIGFFGTLLMGMILTAGSSPSVF